MNDDFAVGISKNLPDPIVQVELLCGEIKASSLRLPGINFLFQGNSLHRNDLRRLRSASRRGDSVIRRLLRANFTVYGGARGEASYRLDDSQGGGRSYVECILLWVLFVMTL